MHYLKLVVISLFAIYIIIFSSIYLFQEKLIFFPDTLPEDYKFDFLSNYEELFLDATDGARLNALHFKVQNPKGVILYFHGNAGSLASWGEVVQKFADLNYDVLVMDFRGYGKSTGDLNEISLYKDAQIFYNYLLNENEQENIIVYGRSLGTTFATYVAAQNNPRQLILEAPFFSLEKIASAMFPIYPISRFLKYEFPTYKYITQVNCPISIFHGTEDSLINIQNSEDLVDLASNKIIKLIRINGANHNDLEMFESYRIHLKEVLSRKKVGTLENSL